jgi:hypothetical protein
MVKKGLQKLGLLKGHISDWDIELPWLAMGYQFNKQTSFSSFPLEYILLLGVNFNYKHPFV